MVLLAAAAEAGDDCRRGGVYSPQWLTANPFGLRMTLRGRTRGSRRKEESTCLPFGNVGSSPQLVGAPGAFVVCGGDWQGGEEEEEKEEQGGRDYYGGQDSHRRIGGVIYYVLGIYQWLGDSASAQGFSRHSSAFEHL
ncbi:unnamed protein product [Calypogeia fissa]